VTSNTNLTNNAQSVKLKVGQNRDADDDIEWITVNGARIPIKNGQLQGAAGEKIEAGETMGKDYAKINRQIKGLINQRIVNPSIGEAKAPVPAKIKSVNYHGMKRGITREEAQGFIDNAVVMFDQKNRSLYVSGDGNAVLLDKGNRLISAYRKEDFDSSTKAILEVLDNGN
jgi:hypothetical protein